jgi:CubicO group peptidase (beta-lactamase class C family)
MLSVGCLALGAVAHGEDVSSILEPLRAKHDVPALAAAVMKDGQLVAIGATGVRCVGEPEKVTIDDQWHLASCTKSMTASAIAMLVDRGELHWDTTVGSTLDKLAPKMNAAWKDVPLELLLGHRAGAPHEPPPALWLEAARRKGTNEEQRNIFVRGLLDTAPDPKPGTGFVYSNQGYTIAAAMATTRLKKPWEEWITELVFRPLGLKSAGFGAAGTPGKTDQPFGHVRKDGTVRHFAPGPNADNPPAIWPGGGVHMSIGDFARYAAWHAEGARLLKPETFARLHTPLAGQDYGFGWISTTRPWGGKVIMHNGTNTMNFAVMWISPEKKFAVVAACNMGGGEAEKACDDACAMLIGRVLEQK